ncbi:hypothetical protein AAJ76_2600031558 [Vairimorpha ceranae]|uniref:Uncharacterized protein n=1 Tax=Vairimorpha ceranae TaxID=40302 RepID=A0A0F9WEQ7_9MICR|nr:hypothetical protein AAJ76_2600031558 [Vairimorpha ceranae]KKO75275.1 hypothetical protein AAJ76_2600031558 [Vairimorpha ceranae]
MHVKNICIEGKEEGLFYKGITYLILKGTYISENTTAKLSVCQIYIS